MEDRRHFFDSTSKAAVSASALSLRCSSRPSSLTRRRSCRASTALAARGSPRPAIASRFQASNSVGYSPCSRHQALRVASSIVAVTITACSRAAAVQRGLPAPDPLARALARQRSNVATLIPTSRDTKSIAELSGGNSRATIRSLYACPYRATFRYPRPQRFRSYLGGNFSDTGGHTESDPLPKPSQPRPVAVSLTQQSSDGARINPAGPVEPRQPHDSAAVAQPGRCRTSRLTHRETMAGAPKLRRSVSQQNALTGRKPQPYFNCLTHRNKLKSPNIPRKDAGDIIEKGERSKLEKGWSIARSHPAGERIRFKSKARMCKRVCYCSRRHVRHGQNIRVTCRQIFVGKRIGDCSQAEMRHLKRRVARVR